MVKIGGDEVFTSSPEESAIRIKATLARINKIMSEISEICEREKTYEI